MGETVSPIHLIYMSINGGRQHTWTRCEHVNHIQKELRPKIKSKFLLLWDSTIKNSTTKPPTTEKLLCNLYYCKRPHFTSFLLTQTHRHRHAPTRLQLQLCNMQFHTQFTVTKRPWTHQMLPQCSTDRPEAGGGHAPLSQHMTSWLHLDHWVCLDLHDLSVTVNLRELSLSVCSIAPTLPG